MVLLSSHSDALLRCYYYRDRILKKTTDILLSTQ